ncbi:MAG: transcriptional regulator, LacI family [Herbinix sp.]|jgi:LacI family transcriptional regulator|nr:transcriptional regulator, LacI family [Herbinix sp.]
MKKATLQDIADALGISRVTVWKLFSGREGVSEELKNKIIQKAIELNYNLPEEYRLPPKTQPSSNQITISIVVSRPETSLFWMTIIHEIAKEGTKYNINLMYTYLPSAITEDYTLPPLLSNGSVQGIIVLNVYHEKLIKMLSELPTPKVFMDSVNSIPFNELNGDLMLIEGKSCIATIVDHIIELGRTDIGFIGDINYAQTNYERYRGFTHAMNEHNVRINPKYCMIGSIGIDTYQEEIEDFINRLDKLPEAFICASDFIASLLCKSLEKRGYRIPEDIAISGFDGNPEFKGAADLTTVQVHNKDIGIRLAIQALYRIEHPSACYEISYFRSDVIFRESTNFPLKK